MKIIVAIVAGILSIFVFTNIFDSNKEATKMTEEIGQIEDNGLRDNISVKNQTFSYDETVDMTPNTVENTTNATESTKEIQEDLPNNETVEVNLPNDTFVKVRDYIPNIFIDLKYATSENITGTPIYTFTEPYLRYGTVKKLESAYEQLQAQGYSLKIWDGYRPLSAQYKLWEAMPDARYIANPYTGFSNHQRGNAVDLTLVRDDGIDIPMPTGYDDFSALANRNYDDLDHETRENALILEKAMTEAGFEGYFAEWWHYSDEIGYAVEKNFEPAEEITHNISSEKTDVINVSAVGDTLLANGYGFWYNGSIDYYIETLNVGYDYFLEKVQSVIGQDDLTISNAENVFSTRGERANKSWQGNEAFWFRSDPEYAQIYKVGSVEAVNLANNHTLDYGQIGYEDTIAALDKHGITNFGYDRVAYYQVRDYTIALLGHNVLGPLERGVDIEQLKADMKTMLAEADLNADIIISSFHWGIERSKTQNAVQTELALFAIDNGSDLILGHHPHRLQPVEEYKGVPIAYSLGDFVFGGNRYPIKNTMILSVDFLMEGKEIADIQYSKIPARTYGNTSSNNYQPVLVQPVE